MSIEWRIEDNERDNRGAANPAEPTIGDDPVDPEGSGGRTRRLRRVALIIMALIAIAVVVAAVVAWRNRERIEAIEEEVLRVAHLDHEALIDRDAALLETVYGGDPDHELRRRLPGGLASLMPGMSADPAGATLDARVLPPDERGAPIDSAVVSATLRVSDGIETAPLAELRPFRRSKDGRWLREPPPERGSGRDDPPSTLGTVRHTERAITWRASPQHAERARPIARAVDRWVGRFCTDVGAIDEGTCTVALRFHGDQISAVSARDAPIGDDLLKVIELPLPSSRLTALDEDGRELLGRVVARVALRAMVGIKPYQGRLMGVRRDPIEAARTGQLGGRTALKTALLDEWMAHRGLSPVLEAPPDPRTPFANAWVLAEGQAGPLGPAARSFARHVVREGGSDSIPPILTAMRGPGTPRLLEWLRAGLGNRALEVASTWPRAEPFPADRALILACAAPPQRRVVVPGALAPQGLVHTTCPRQSDASERTALQWDSIGAFWSRDGEHLASICKPVDRSPENSQIDGTLLSITSSWPAGRTAVAARTMRFAQGLNDVPIICCPTWSAHDDLVAWITTSPATVRVADHLGNAREITPPSWPSTLSGFFTPQLRPADGNAGKAYPGPRSLPAGEAHRAGTYPGLVQWLADGRLLITRPVANIGQTAPPDATPSGFDVVDSATGSVIWGAESVFAVASTDGRRIAWVREIEPRRQVLVSARAADAGDRQQIELSASYLAPVAWSPDGRYVAAVGGMASGSPAPDGAVEGLAPGTHFVLAWSPDDGVRRAVSVGRSPPRAAWLPDPDATTVVWARDPAALGPNRFGGLDLESGETLGADDLPWWWRSGGLRDESEGWVAASAPRDRKWGTVGEGGVYVHDASGTTRWAHLDPTCVPDGWQPAHD